MTDHCEHDELTFKSSRDWMKHLSRGHPNHFQDGDKCPFCLATLSLTTTGFARHIAAHLREISLASLPPVEYASTSSDVENNDNDYEDVESDKEIEHEDGRVDIKESWTVTEQEIRQWLQEDESRTLRYLFLRQRIEWPAGSEQYFLPNKIINSMTRNILQHELRKTCPDISHSKYDKLIEYICTKSTKLFCVLAFSSPSSLQQDICNFMDEGITDEDLPFHSVLYETDTSGPYYILCKRGHSECLQTRHVYCGMKSTASWTQMKVVNIRQDQRIVSAPTFYLRKLEIPHYEFDRQTILPFVEYNETSALQGDYGKVLSARIHPAHHDLPKSDNPKVMSNKVSL